MTSRIVPPGNPALPSYYRVADDLRQQIASRALRPGDQLPTEAELCRRYGLSRGTVIHALDHLQRQRIIQRRQGRGTFVAEPESGRGTFHILDFSGDMLRRGITPSTRLLCKEVGRAEASVMHALRLTHGELVIRVERLRLGDGKPLALETRYLAYDTCPGLLQEDLEHESIHRLLLEKYRLPLLRAEFAISTTALDSRAARLLDEVAPARAVRVERLTFTVGERPVTLMHSLHPGDEYRFTAEVGPLPAAALANGAVP